MSDYLKLLFNICLFTKGPQDIPFSNRLLRLSMIAFLLVSYLLKQVAFNGVTAFLQAVVELLLVTSFAWLILSFTHNSKRFVQTACALIGTDILISALAFPIISLLSTDNNNFFASLSLLALVIWSWGVLAHIIHHATEKSYFLSMGLVFLYLFISYQSMELLFPPLRSSA